PPAALAAYLATANASADETWEQELVRADDGGLKKNLANTITLLTHSPGWRGALRFDAFAGRLLLLRPTPAHARQPPELYPRTWRDADDVLTAAWLQRDICFEASVEIAAQAILAVAEAHSFHPVRAYFDGLQWDGKARLEQWLTTYLGTPDTDYSRAVGSKWLISAVARTYQPGCKA